MLDPADALAEALGVLASIRQRSPAKLIRDRCPELLAAQGQPCPHTIAASDAEYTAWVRLKLPEEVAEALTAPSPAALVDELGDVLQVLYTLAGLAGATPTAIECARARKATLRGGFARRRIWHPAATPVSAGR